MLIAAGKVGLGFSQTNQLPVRAAGVTYQNTTGKPISINIVFLATAVGATCSVFVDIVSPPVYQAAIITIQTVGEGLPATLIIPPNHFYRVTVVNGILSLWNELR